MNKRDVSSKPDTLLIDVIETVTGILDVYKDSLKTYWRLQASDMGIHRINMFEYESLDELVEKLSGSCWAIGEAFIYRNLCFINQVEGGNEMMLFSGQEYIDSISCSRYIKQDRNGFINNCIKLYL